MTPVSAKRWKPRLAPRPLLVTGVPRSGTTWLARLLALAPGTALTGREPMNPGNGDYALGHTLTGWTMLQHLSPRQGRLLRLAYSGLNPWVYGRYGERQSLAPLPWTRVVVKDPFAMLSVPTLVRETGAVPVLIYRHPGAALASYRRMGWTPDVGQLRTLLAGIRTSSSPQWASDPSPGVISDPVRAMGWFWSTLHLLALTDTRPPGWSEEAGGADRPPPIRVVSHEELALGGPSALRRLYDSLGLRWHPRAGAALAPSSGGSSGPWGRPVGESGAPTILHDFAREPASVATAWRSVLSATEIDAMDGAAGDVYRRLHALRTPLIRA